MMKKPSGSSDATKPFTLAGWALLTPMRVLRRGSPHPAALEAT